MSYDFTTYSDDFDLLLEEERVKHVINYIATKQALKQEEAKNIYNHIIHLTDDAYIQIIKSIVNLLYTKKDMSTDGFEKLFDNDRLKRIAIDR